MLQFLRYGKPYSGPVAFRDGTHYVAGSHNRDGSDRGPRLSRPLRWDNDLGGYRYARPNDRSHLATYRQADLELTPGSEG